jgi:hypothetical protein
MNRFRQFICAILLVAALTASTRAGETPTPGVTLPPPPISSAGETPTPGASELLFELLYDVAGVVLPLF